MVHLKGDIILKCTDAAYLKVFYCADSVACCILPQTVSMIANPSPRSFVSEVISKAPSPQPLKHCLCSKPLLQCSCNYAESTGLCVRCFGAIKILYFALWCVTHSQVSPSTLQQMLFLSK